MVWDSMELGEDTFEPRPLPPDLAESYATERGQRIVLLFSGDEGRVREEFDPTAIERMDDGRLRVTLHTELTDRARHYLLSFGADLFVEELAELREWIRREAAAILRCLLYTSPAPPPRWPTSQARCPPGRQEPPARSRTHTRLPIPQARQE